MDYNWLSLPHCRNYLLLGHYEYSSTHRCLYMCIYYIYITRWYMDPRMSSQTSMFILYRQSIDIKSALVLMWMSPSFSFTVLGAKSCGMALLFGLTVPQQYIYFTAKSSKTERSMYNLWPHPFMFLVNSVTVAWVAVKYCAMCHLSFHKYTVYIQSYMYPVESQSLKILMPKHLHLLSMYCMKNTLPLKGTVT